MEQYNKKLILQKQTQRVKMVNILITLNIVFIWQLCVFVQ